MHRNSVFVIVLLTISFCVRIQCNDNAIDLNEIQSKLPEGFKIPESLQNQTLPSVDEMKKGFQQKCKKVLADDVKGEERFKAIEEGAERLKNCTVGLIDVEQLQKEIEDAQPSGELDIVFNKYCRKRTIAIECVQNFTDVLSPCLEPKELEGQKTFVKIFTNLLNFVCHKDGDQIALFIAEKGPECFSEQKDELTNCMNKTFYNYMPSEKEVEANLPAQLPQLVMGAEQCNDMDTLQLCVVKSLEKCEESTPANLVESMFKFVRNETPCVNITTSASKLKAKQNSSSGAGIGSVSSTLLATLFSLFIIRSIAA